MAFNIDGLLERLGIVRDESVGIAFSGGGAKGFSHIGVLMAFEHFGMLPNVLSGVSAGAIAATLYGAGLSPHEMIECFTEASRFADFTEWSLPKKGFLKLDRFGKLLESWLPVRNLEEMKIPTVICATDIEHGKSVGWGKGEIVPRVLASCSIPIIFNPVKINGVAYVDGGVLRNLPAWAIRDYCRILYGSNCTPLSQKYDKKGGLIEVAYRTFQLMMKANMPQDLRMCDYVITSPILTEVGTFDLSSINKGVTAGYDATCRVLEAALNR